MPLVAAVKPSRSPRPTFDCPSPGLRPKPARCPRVATASSIAMAVGTSGSMMGMLTLIGVLAARPAAATGATCRPARGYPGTDGVHFANLGAFASLDGDG